MSGHSGMPRAIGVQSGKSAGSQSIRRGFGPPHPFRASFDPRVLFWTHRRLSFLILGTCALVVLPDIDYPLKTVTCHNSFVFLVTFRVRRPNVVELDLGVATLTEWLWEGTQVQGIGFPAVSRHLTESVTQLLATRSHIPKDIAFTSPSSAPNPLS